MFEWWQSLWPGVTSWDGWSTGEIGILVVVVLVLIVLKER